MKNLSLLYAIALPERIYMVLAQLLLESSHGSTTIHLFHMLI